MLDSAELDLHMPRALEVCIRTALLLGELSPGAAAQIAHYAETEPLSLHDKRLLSLLSDAIQSGSIRRVELS